MDKELGKLGEYIYLVQERESIRCKDNIYKIGKTTQKPMKRMSAYPTGSKLWITIIVNKSSVAENDLIEIFKIKFKQIRNIGKEYFFGNPIDMMNEIIKYQQEHFNLEIETDVNNLNEIKHNENDESESDDNEDNENINESDNDNEDNEDINESDNEDNDNDDMSVSSKAKRSRSRSSSSSIIKQSKSIQDVLLELRHPIQVSRYTKILAEQIKKQTRFISKYSADVYISCTEKSKIFDVTKIVLISPTKEREVVDISNIDVDPDEDINKLELNTSHYDKFKRSQVSGLNDYILHVCSFELKRYKFISFYKTIFLPNAEIDDE